MAVKDESLHHATEDLILPTPRKYYQALIYNSHWQLRALIASPEPHIVYYPSSNDIIALNTKSRQREIITSLPFPPRCLTASKDFICIGGEQGNYTAIPLGTRSGGTDTSSNLDLDADVRLPLDLDPSQRSLLRESQNHFRRARGNNRPITPKIIKVGTEIVNCVTIWSPSKNTASKAYKEPVAVVSNNDCTVSILKLDTSEILQQLVLPDYVNRSVMSPDGALLATISDDPYLYLHERKKKTVSTQDQHSSASSQSDEYEWALLCRIQLEGQRPAEKSEMRGSFAACFSNSGKYLAVATQYGIISVFDVETITGTESLVAVFTTSRPSTERDCGGAVRAMEFSPGFFDLLAWTESTGRVGVADMRTLCFSRQLVIMDHNSDSVERVRITESSSDTVIDPRLRTFRTESPSSSTTPDYLGLDLDRPHIRSLTREMLDRQQSPLTAEELEVLQAHRVARRQRDAASVVRDDGASSSRWSSEYTEGSRLRMTSAMLPAALREFVSQDRSAASFRSFINDRNQDRERRVQQPQDSRRRSAVLLAAAENALERENLGSEGARNSTGTDSPNNPWAEIDLYRSRFLGDQPPERSTRLRIELEDEDRRNFAHRLRQPWRPTDDHSQANLTSQERQILISVGNPTHRSVTIETMGCCWSEDGRILYVGGSNGIYEYHVNVAGRKMFPSLVLR